MAVRLAAMGVAISLLWGPSASAVGTTEQIYFITGLLVVSAVSAPFAANADPDGGYDRSGPYLGAGATLAINTFESETRDLFESLSDGQVGAGTEVTDGFGGYMNVGYRFTPRIAGEVEFEWLGQFESSAEIPDDPDTTITFSKTKTWLVSGNAKGFFLTGSIQPYGLVGVGAMTAKTEDTQGLGLFDDKTTDLVFRFGAGVDFYLSERFVTNVNIDYAYPINTLKDLNFVVLGIGLQYRF
jgi:outer membrane protein W